MVLLAQGARRQRTCTPPSASHRGSYTESLTVHWDLKKLDYLPSHISHSPKQPTHKQSSTMKLLSVTHEWRGETTFLSVYWSCSRSQSSKYQIPLEPAFLKNWPLWWHHALEYSIHIWNWLTVCSPKSLLLPGILEDTGAICIQGAGTLI